MVVVHATPTVVSGEVYFGTATFPAFYKLDKDGKQLWVYRDQQTRRAHRRFTRLGWQSNISPRCNAFVLHRGKLKE
jgi:hypothetical protein